MTVLEAKKIIEMCTDIDSMNGKPYVNKEYVLNILEMIDEPSSPQPGLEPDKNWPWYPQYPQIWYNPCVGPEKEKVPWWYDEQGFKCAPNTTGSRPGDADIVINSAKSIHRYDEALHTDTK